MGTSVAFLYTLLFLPTIIKGEGNNHFKTVYQVPLDNFPLRNLEFDSQDNSFFVSGKNVLYKFGLNGEKRKEKKTGPDKNCFPSEEDSKKYCGDDENSVMIVTPDSLITCSTLYGGRCIRREKGNLNDTSKETTIALVSKLDAAAVGTYVNVTVMEDSKKLNNKSLLLFAKQYTPLRFPLPKLERSAIFSVSPNLTGKVFGISLTESTILDAFLHEQWEGRIVLDYRVILQNDDFVFLLVNQEDKILKYRESKLVKICKTIDVKNLKKVYEDIPITCSKDGTNFTDVKHGTFVTHLDDRYLVALFSNSEGSSAVCVYSENEIYTGFLESRRSRYGCPKMDLPSKFLIFDGAKNIEKCGNMWLNESELPDGVFEAFNSKTFCNKVSSGAPAFGIIIGQLPLRQTAVYTTDIKVTVVGSNVINDLITLYVGTVEGNVIKIYLDEKAKEAHELERIKIDISNIMAIRTVREQEIYIMSENKIVKILEETCENFSTSCSSCMMARNAKCGWCITSKRCVEKGSCSNKTNFWLPSVRNQCLQLKMEGESNYGVQLDNPNEVFKKKVYFEPPIQEFTNMSCKLGNNVLTLEVQSDHVQCSIQNIPRDKRGNVTLSILLNGDIIASTDLLFYNCSSFKSCGDCVEGGRTKCYWCPKEGSCRYSRGGCTEFNFSIEPSKKQSCPQLLESTVDVPNAQKENVTLLGKNLQSFYAYSCFIDKVQYKGIFMNESRITCQDVQISYQERTPVSDLKAVEIKYAVNRSHTPELILDRFGGGTYLKAYKCEFLSPNKKDCSTCNYQRSIGYEYCSHCGDDTGCTSRVSCTEPKPCKGPEVLQFEPTTGPIGGGTQIKIKGINLGEKAKQVNNVTVAGVPCTGIKMKDREIKCTTGNITSPKTGPIVVTIQNQMSEPSKSNFEYKDPVILDINPNEGIKSGGGQIRIIGENLNIGNMRYQVTLVPLPEVGEDAKSKPCNKPVAMNNYIVCRPNGSTKKGKHTVEVTFDSDKTSRRLSANKAFRYLDDPTITGTEPSELKSIKSGGIKFMVKGTGFADVLQDLYTGLSKYPNSNAPCTRRSDTVIQCSFPGVPESRTRRRKKRQVSNADARESVKILIHLDGFQETLTSNVLYVPDPVLLGNDTISFDPDRQQDITLKGENLAQVTRKEDYFILVGSGECALTRLNDSELVCRPPSREPAPRAQEDRLYIRVRVGNFNRIAGIVEYANELPIAYIAIGVLGVLLVVFFIGAFLIHRKMRTRNQLKIEQIMTEMHDIEQNTMRMNQEEFAEMQLNITDIKRDLVSTGIPYHSYQNYTQYVLFPKEVEAGSLTGLLQHSGFSSKNVEKAMDQFEKLMSNKYFVKSLIGTLERQRKITLIDKAQFSANFSVVMMGKMRDFFEIVNCLLSTLVDASHKKQHKTLFNRFESITLRLLSHWLSVSLYPYLKEGGGSSLFMLYKSTQAVVEKRPVDEVMGEAKNTLSEDNFLREKIDFQTLKLEIDLNGNGNLYTCEVLDCDTVNQVKSKCLYQIYKNRPASDMPTIDEVDLEWMAGKSGRLALSNIDQTSERGDGMVRCNTLQHYHVLDGSRMALLYKFSPDDEQEEDTYVNQRSPSDVDIAIPPNVQLIQSVSSTGSLENLRRWHLVKNMEEEDSHEKNLKLKDKVKTSHITNLMHTKLVLQDNIKEVFDSVLNHENIPLVVHYLFGVLENLADENGVEPETLLCWKSESYAMRVWATLLVRPEFLFDIQKVKHVEPCLDVIKQVFIDCFHSTKISKDSSLQKLLFAQEVPHYQKRTEQFYKALANKAAVTDADFWNEMSRLNTLQQEHLKFSKPAALQKLYKFVQQYIEEIIEDLDEGPETSGLQFGKKLDDIFRQMETDS